MKQTPNIIVPADTNFVVGEHLVPLSFNVDNFILASALYGTTDSYISIQNFNGWVRDGKIVNKAVIKYNLYFVPNHDINQATVNANVNILILNK